MAEQMTSKERVLAAITMSEIPDQLPVVPLLLTRAIREGGTTCDKAQVDGELMAHCKIKAGEKFGGDVVVAGTDLFTPVEVLGAELDYLPYAQPSLVKHPTPTKEDFYRVRDEYQAKGFDSSKGRIQHINREIEILNDKVGATHALGTPVGGPITTAQLMTGSSEFLTMLSEDPDYAHEVIALALDVVKNICREHQQAGALFVNILDPFVSCDILPPDVFREFGLPAEKELFAYCTELGLPAFTHVCTYIQPILKDLASNGCLNVNGDFYPDMGKAKQMIGGEISLMGGLGPFTTLLTGTPKDVEMEVKKLAVEAGYNGGFLCMPGCDIDWTIPDENLKALVDTCASIKYPMDIDSFGDLSNIYLPGNPQHPATRVNTTEGDAAVLAGEQGKMKTDTPEGEVYAKLVEAIMEYDGDKAIEWTNKGLELGLTPQQIVFDGLSLGMKIVGDMYERNERFVTDMMKAAKTMEKAMPIIEPLLEASGSAEGPTGTVVVGLVRGNTQDIGKNLVCLMLKANGFKVIDLGKNVKPEEFLNTAKENDAVAIGMSVMTNSSAVYVEKLVDLVKEGKLEDKFVLVCGGASANVGLARKFGIHYGSDANAAVSIVRDKIAA